jgi:hypothetical protein
MVVTALCSAAKNMKKIPILFLLILPGMVAAAEWGKFDFEFENEKPWSELQAMLPAYPRQENLLPFFVSAATDNLFYIDAPSISVGEDGVVRYVLMVKSPEGAVNVTFEGMRCATHEMKIYAFGRVEGNWSKARFGKWEQIHYADRNRQHHVLYDDFLCPSGLTVNSSEVAVKAFKAGIAPIVHN